MRSIILIGNQVYGCFSIFLDNNHKATVKKTYEFIWLMPNSFYCYYYENKPNIRNKHATNK